MPVNGDVFLEPNPHGKGFIRGVLPDIIEWRTHSDKVHTRGYLSGYVYEDTVWHQNGVLHSGVKITPYSDAYVLGYERRSLVDPLSDNEIECMIRFGQWQHDKGFPYNDIMLVAFLAVYPLRGWLEKERWVPFKKSVDFVCSSFWAEMLGFVGRQVKPGIDPSEIVPGDFDTSPLYKV